MVLLVLAVLAVYRLATDLAWEDGPFDAYGTLRGRVLTRYGKDDWRSAGVSCPICISFWLSIPLAFVVAPWDATLVLYWLGIAGAAALLARVSTP